MKKRGNAILALILAVCMVLPTTSISYADDEPTSYQHLAATAVHEEYTIAAPAGFTAGTNQIISSQGGYTDGTNAYQAFIRITQDPDYTGPDPSEYYETEYATTDVCLVKYSIAGGNSTVSSAFSGGNSLHHANDITVKDGSLVLTHARGDRKKVSFINPSTLTVQSTVTLAKDIFCIDYNATKDQYVAGKAGSQQFWILNSDFTVAAGPFASAVETEGYTTQGVTCDEEYIYFVLSFPNVITKYDWDGNLVAVIDLSIIPNETEWISKVGDTLYVASADNNGTKAVTVYSITSIGSDSAYNTYAARIAHNGTKEYYTTLESAVAAAQDGEKVDVLRDVTVSAQMDIEGSITIAGEGVTITKSGSFSGSNIFHGEIGSVITIKGMTASKDSLTIQGTGTAGSCMVYSHGPIHMENVTLTNGNGEGGAVKLPYKTDNDGADAAAELVAVNCAFTGNTYNGAGGAVYITAGTKGASFTDCVFSDNSATNGQGGAVYVGNSNSYTTVSFDHCTFSGNTATGNAGALRTGVNTTINNCVFTNNSVTASTALGGAIYVTSFSGNIHNSQNNTFIANSALHGGAIAVASNGAATLEEGNAFESNTAANMGGAIYAGGDSTHSATVSLSGCSFTSNVATDKGGAVNVGDYGTITADDCTFAGNSTTIATGTNGGGAMYIATRNGASVTDCTFSSNTSARHGGAICASSSAAMTILSSGNSFISNRAAGNGGGAIYTNDSTVTVSSSGDTFRENETTANNGGAIYAKGALATESDSFIANRATATGGAVQTESSFSSIGDVFTDNTAGANGGALCTNGGTATLNNDVFTGNAALNRGGVLYTTGNTTITVNGGSMANNETTGTSTGNHGGGAVCQNNGTVTLNGVDVRENHSHYNGGAVLVFTGSLNVTGCTFDENTAAHAGDCIAKSSKNDVTVTLSGRIAGAEVRSVADADATVAIGSDGLSAGTDVTLGRYAYSEGAQAINGASGVLSDAVQYIKVAPDSSNTSWKLCADGTITSTGIARIDDTYYNSFDAAMADVTDGTPTTIELLANVALTGRLNIGASENDARDITLTGNGFAITKKASFGSTGMIRVFPGSSLTIDGLTVDGGKQSGPALIWGQSGNPSGGSIALIRTVVKNGLATTNNSGSGVNFEMSGSFSVTDCVFKSNTGANAGGAIRISTNATNAVISGTAFTENSANNGGAIYSNCNGMTISNCTFTQNTADGSSGGGAIWSDRSIVSFGNTYTGNVGMYGGAIRQHTAGYTLTSTNDTFSANRADASGGALVVTGVAVVTNGVFTDNEAQTAGGAVNVVGNATLKMVGGSMSGNCALTNGGAVYLQSKSAFEVSGGVVVENNDDQNDDIDIWMNASDAVLDLSGAAVTIASAKVNANGVIQYAKFTDASMTLSSGIGMNFALQQYAGLDTELTVDFTWHDGEKSAVGVTATDGFFRCQIAAKEISDTITAEIKNGDDTLYTMNYSGSQYLTALAAAYPAYADIANAVAVYGEAAKAYFIEGSDPVSVEGFTGVSETFLSGTTESESVSLYSKSVLTKDTTVLRLYLKADEQPTVTVDGVSASVKANQGYWCVDISVAPKKIAQSFTVDVNGGALHFTIGVNDYIYAAIEKYGVNAELNADKSTMIELCKALYLYGQAASALS